MILMIDNYDSFTYNIVQMLGELGADVKVARNDSISIAEIEAMGPDAIVVSPGPGNPDSAGISLEAIRHFAGKKPIMGICLGHQSIAQAFGGKVVHAKKMMHGKTSRLRHDGKGLFLGIDQDMVAMRYHSLAVERESLPECLEITAESEDGEIMGLRHKTMKIESLQYHPESIGTPEGRRQLKNFLDMASGRAQTVAATFAERKDILKKALEGKLPREDEVRSYFAAIMGGGVKESEVAAFLATMAKLPVTADVLVGAALAMREAGEKIDLGDIDAVDIVGTGGDGTNSFNVSTAAACVAAGAGAVVAKHGNVASTSKCGSADVLRALGLNLDAPKEKVERCIREVGLGFLFAKNLHPAMRFASPVRACLGFRTIFNLLGPLANPAGVRRNVIGVCEERLARVFAESLKRLGSKAAYVVCGQGGMDEISPGGITFVSTLKDGVIANTLLDAGRLYGESYAAKDIAGADAESNAKMLLRVLRGEERGACRAAAIENAAAALVVAEKASGYAEGIAMAAESIDSGRALAKLEKMIEAVK